MRKRTSFRNVSRGFTKTIRQEVIGFTEQSRIFSYTVKYCSCQEPDFDIQPKHGLIFKLGLVYQSMIVCSICKVISNGIEEFEKHLIGQHKLLDGPSKIVHYIAYWDNE